MKGTTVIQLQIMVAMENVGPVLPHFLVFQELLKIGFFNSGSSDF